MRLTDKALVLAATDLSNFLACRHLSGLDLAAAMGKVAAPVAPVDAALKLLREKGAAHERAYVEHLREQGLTVVEIDVYAPHARGGFSDEKHRPARRPAAIGSAAEGQPY